MDESRDEQFEVLDVGGRHRDRGWTDPELPPIQLDDVPREPPEPPELPEPGGDRPVTWRRAGVVLGAMALAVVATALVMDARDKAADNAAAAETVDLILGDMRDRQGVVPGQMTAQLDVTVHNAGPRDVDVLSIHPTGWSNPPDQDPGARTVAAGGWTVVPMPVVPSCDGPTPTTLEAEIRTEAGEQAVTLDRARGSYSALGRIREALCQPAFERERVWLWVMDVELLTTDSDGLPMKLLVQADPVDGVVITEVTTGTPGFHVEAVDVPATVSSDVSSSGIDVVWSVTDCDDATTFDDADIQFQVKGEGRVEGNPTLPTAAVAGLARYALTVCDQ